MAKAAKIGSPLKRAEDVVQPNPHALKGRGYVPLRGKPHK